MATRYTWAETQQLRHIRQANPTDSQRTLARRIKCLDISYPELSRRSIQSIYGALRKLDAELKTVNPRTHRPFRSPVAA